MIIDSKAATYQLDDSLIIPIGAKSKSAIEKYVGTVQQMFGNDNCFLVSFSPLANPNELEVWKQERSFFLNYKTQLWVDVDYRNYRKIYKTVFENVISESEYVVDHIMNRKLAKNLGYKFVRLLHISRSSNSSGGRGGETYGNKFLQKGIAYNSEININDIVYADPMDLLKMLNIKVGGFPLDSVRDNQHIFYQ